MDVYHFQLHNFQGMYKFSAHCMVYTYLFCLNAQSGFDFFLFFFLLLVCFAGSLVCFGFLGVFFKVKLV